MGSNLNIAVVEDNDDLRSLLVGDLSIAGYSVLGADSADELEELCAHNTFDVLILDVNLPGENGFSIAARYKKFNSFLYIVMLTARGSIPDRVKGYEVGADLYLTKPVSNTELVAAIDSIARRLVAQKQSPEIILNLRNLTLVGKGVVDLNRHEAYLIKALCEAHSFNLPYFKLIELCGLPVDEFAKAALEVRIVRLRKKFKEVGVEKSLKSLRGNGYQLLVDVQIIS